MSEQAAEHPKAIMSWSSGKDSAMALHRVLSSGEFEVVCLLTTITESFHRVSMHGVREELLDLQAKSARYPMEKIFIPYPCPNEIYEGKMRNALDSWKTKGVSQVIFGDLFLEDIRRYREEKLSQIGIRPVFPIWGENTRSLAEEMLKVGFRAIITCVDPKKLEPKFAGRQFDESFLRDLPPQVDPCGENGEFHTFVYDGPIFKEPIPVEVGERVLRDGFQFADVMSRSTKKQALSGRSNYSQHYRYRNGRPASKTDSKSSMSETPVFIFRLLACSVRKIRGPNPINPTRLGRDWPHPNEGAVSQRLRHLSHFISQVESGKVVTSVTSMKTQDSCASAAIIKLRKQ